MQIYVVHNINIVLLILFIMIVRSNCEVNSNNMISVSKQKTKSSSSPSVSAILMDCPHQRNRKARKKCERKVMVNLRVNPSMQLDKDEKFLVLDELYDTKKKARRKILSPYVIQLSRGEPIQMYPLEFTKEVRCDKCEENNTPSNDEVVTKGKLKKKKHKDPKKYTNFVSNEYLNKNKRNFKEAKRSEKVRIAQQKNNEFARSLGIEPALDLQLQYKKQNQQVKKIKQSTKREHDTKRLQLQRELNQLIKQQNEEIIPKQVHRDVQSKKSGKNLRNIQGQQLRNIVSVGPKQRARLNEYKELGSKYDDDYNIELSELNPVKLKEDDINEKLFEELEKFEDQPQLNIENFKSDNVASLEPRSCITSNSLKTKSFKNEQSKKKQQKINYRRVQYHKKRNHHKSNGQKEKEKSMQNDKAMKNEKAKFTNSTQYTSKIQQMTENKGNIQPGNILPHSQNTSQNEQYVIGSENIASNLDNKQYSDTNEQQLMYEPTEERIESNLMNEQNEQKLSEEPNWATEQSISNDQNSGIEFNLQNDQNTETRENNLENDQILDNVQNFQRYTLHRPEITENTPEIKEYIHKPPITEYDLTDSNLSIEPLRKLSMKTTKNIVNNKYKNYKGRTDFGPKLATGNEYTNYNNMNLHQNKLVLKQPTRDNILENVKSRKVETINSIKPPSRRHHKYVNRIPFIESIIRPSRKNNFHSILKYPTNLQYISNRIEIPMADSSIRYKNKKNKLKKVIEDTAQEKQNRATMPMFYATPNGFFGSINVDSLTNIADSGLELDNPLQCSIQVNKSCNSCIPDPEPILICEACDNNKKIQQRTSKGTNSYKCQACDKKNSDHSYNQGTHNYILKFRKNGKNIDFNKALTKNGKNKILFDSKGAPKKNHKKLQFSNKNSNTKLNKIDQISRNMSHNCTISDEKLGNSRIPITETSTEFVNGNENKIQKTGGSCSIYCTLKLETPHKCDDNFEKSYNSDEEPIRSGGSCNSSVTYNLDENKKTQSQRFKSKSKQCGHHVNNSKKCNNESTEGSGSSRNSNKPYNEATGAGGSCKSYDTYSLDENEETQSERSCGSSHKPKSKPSGNHFNNSKTCNNEPTQGCDSSGNSNTLQYDPTGAGGSYNNSATNNLEENEERQSERSYGSSNKSKSKPCDGNFNNPKISNIEPTEGFSSSNKPQNKPCGRHFDNSKTCNNEPTKGCGNSGKSNLPDNNPTGAGGSCNTCDTSNLDEYQETQSERSCGSSKKPKSKPCGGNFDNSKISNNEPTEGCCSFGSTNKPQNITCGHHFDNSKICNNEPAEGCPSPGCSNKPKNRPCGRHFDNSKTCNEPTEGCGTCSNSNIPDNEPTRSGESCDNCATSDFEENQQSQLEGSSDNSNTPSDDDFDNSKRSNNELTEEYGSAAGNSNTPDNEQNGLEGSSIIIPIGNFKLREQYDSPGLIRKSKSIKNLNSIKRLNRQSSNLEDDNLLSINNDETFLTMDMENTINNKHNVERSCQENNLTSRIFDESSFEDILDNQSNEEVPKYDDNVENYNFHDYLLKPIVNNIQNLNSDNPLIGKQIIRSTNERDSQLTNSDGPVAYQSEEENGFSFEDNQNDNSKNKRNYLTNTNSDIDLNSESLTGSVDKRQSSSYPQFADIFKDQNLETNDKIHLLDSLQEQDMKDGNILEDEAINSNIYVDWGEDVNRLSPPPTSTKQKRHFIPQHNLIKGFYDYDFNSPLELQSNTDNVEINSNINKRSCTMCGCQNSQLIDLDDNTCMCDRCASQSNKNIQKKSGSAESICEICGGKLGTGINSGKCQCIRKIKDTENYDDTSELENFNDNYDETYLNYNDLEENNLENDINNGNDEPAMIERSKRSTPNLRYSVYNMSVPLQFMTTQIQIYRKKKNCWWKIQPSITVTTLSAIYANDDLSIIFSSHVDIFQPDKPLKILQNHKLLVPEYNRDNETLTVTNNLIAIDENKYNLNEMNVNDIDTNRQLCDIASLYRSENRREYRHVNKDVINLGDFGYFPAHMNILQQCPNDKTHLCLNMVDEQVPAYSVKIEFPFRQNDLIPDDLYKIRITDIVTDATTWGILQVTLIVINEGLIAHDFKIDIKSSGIICPSITSFVTKNLLPHISETITFLLPLEENKPKPYPSVVYVKTMRNETVAKREFIINPTSRCFCIRKCNCHCIPSLVSSVDSDICHSLTKREVKEAGFSENSKRKLLSKTLLKITLILVITFICISLVLGCIKAFWGLTCPIVNRYGYDYIQPMHKYECATITRRFFINTVFFLVIPFIFICTCFIRNEEDELLKNEWGKQKSFDMFDTDNDNYRKYTGGSDEDCDDDDDDDESTILSQHIEELSVRQPKNKSDCNMFDSTNDENDSDSNGLMAGNNCNKIINQMSGEHSSEEVNENDSRALDAFKLIRRLLASKIVYRTLKVPLGSVVVPSNHSYSIRGYFVPSLGTGYQFFTPVPLRQYYIICPEAHTLRGIVPPNIIDSRVFTRNYRNRIDVLEAGELSLSPSMNAPCVNVLAQDRRMYSPVKN